MSRTAGFKGKTPTLVFPPGLSDRSTPRSFKAGDTVINNLGAEYWYESGGDVWIERDGSMAMSWQRLRGSYGPLVRLRTTKEGEDGT